MLTLRTPERGTPPVTRSAPMPLWLRELHAHDHDTALRLHHFKILCNQTVENLRRLTLAVESGSQRTVIDSHTSTINRMLTRIERSLRDHPLLPAPADPLLQSALAKRAERVEAASQSVLAERNCEVMKFNELCAVIGRDIDLVADFAIATRREPHWEATVARRLRAACTSVVAMMHDDPSLTIANAAVANYVKKVLPLIEKQAATLRNNDKT